MTLICISKVMLFLIELNILILTDVELATPLTVMPYVLTV